MVSLLYQVYGWPSYSVISVPSIRLTEKWCHLFTRYTVDRDMMWFLYQVYGWPRYDVISVPGIRLTEIWCDFCTRYTVDREMVSFLYQVYGWPRNGVISVIGIRLFEIWCHFCTRYTVVRDMVSFLYQVYGWPRNGVISVPGIRLFEIWCHFCTRYTVVRDMVSFLYQVYGCSRYGVISGYQVYGWPIYVVMSVPCILLFEIWCHFCTRYTAGRDMVSFLEYVGAANRTRLQNPGSAPSVGSIVDFSSAYKVDNRSYAFGAMLAPSMLFYIIIIEYWFGFALLFVFGIMCSIKYFIYIFFKHCFQFFYTKR